MENCTDSVKGSHCFEDRVADPGLLAYLATLMVTLTGIFALYITTISLLLCDKNILKLLKIFLVNLLLAGTSACVCAFIVALMAVILASSNSDALFPSVPFCSFVLYGYYIGSEARIYGLTGYSIMVLLIVRFNRKVLRLYQAVIFLALLWIIPAIVTVYISIPQVVPTYYSNQVLCFTAPTNTSTTPVVRYLFSANLVLVGGISPLVISTAVPIIVICHNKHSAISQQTPYGKVMVKLGLFLLLGNSLNFTGQTVISAVSLSYGASLGIYVAYGFGTIFLVPTPILILVILKPNLSGKKHRRLPQPVASLRTNPTQDAKDGTGTNENINSSSSTMHAQSL